MRGPLDPGEEGSGQHQLVSSRFDWRDGGGCGRKGCEEQRRVTDEGGGDRGHPQWPREQSIWGSVMIHKG